MSYVTAVFAVLVRLLRPTCGVHTGPLGYVRELVAELLRRRRARRVRRYAQDLPHLAEDAEPVEEEVPVVPAPRRPVDDTLTTASAQMPTLDEQLGPRCESDELVPGYYRAWEHRQRLFGVDRMRRGPAGWAAPVADEFRVGMSA